MGFIKRLDVFNASLNPGFQLQIANRKLQISDVPVALLAGGLATRLRPHTEKIPKALVELAGKPFIDHQLELLHQNGIRKVVFCLGYLGEMVERHLGEGSRFGMQLRYAYDGEKLLGTGGALRRAAHLLDGTFWVMYGDSYMDIDYAAVLHDFASRNVLGLMTVLKNNDQWDRSNVVFENGQLIRYDKKNQTHDMRHIDYGVAILRREALDRIPPDQPYDLATLYTQLVAEGQMSGFEVTNRFYEIGTPTSLDEARRYLETRAGQTPPTSSPPGRGQG
jgi:NDP-sugar pyrophosphorylase family protein